MEEDKSSDKLSSSRWGKALRSKKDKLKTSSTSAKRPTSSSLHASEGSLSLSSSSETDTLSSSANNVESTTDSSRRSLQLRQPIVSGAATVASRRSSANSAHLRKTIIPGQAVSGPVHTRVSAGSIRAESTEILPLPHVDEKLTDLAWARRVTKLSVPVHVLQRWRNADPSDIALVTKMQAFVRGYIARRARKHYRVFMELLKTEQSYIDDLKILVSEFLKPLRASQLLPETSITEIFSCIDILYDFHSAFYSKLKGRYEDGYEAVRVNSVGDLFAKHRVPRYLMLLREMKRYVCMAGTAEKDLTEAIDRVRDIVREINERKRQSEQVLAAKTIQSSIRGWDAVEAALTHASHSDMAENRRYFGLLEVLNRSNRPRELLLFSDVVLECTVERAEEDPTVPSASGSDSTAVLTRPRSGSSSASDGLAVLKSENENTTYVVEKALYVHEHGFCFRLHESIPSSIRIGKRVYAIRAVQASQVAALTVANMTEVYHKSTS